jgi:hypothetical protein
MKKICLMIILSFLSSCLISASQNSAITPGDPSYFPLITGANLNGQNYNLPKDFSGKINIVTIGFEREHQIAIDTWIPQIQKLIESNKTLSIKFYELPVIYELGTFSRAWINNGMRIGIRDEEARNRTITIFTNRDKFIEILKMKIDKIYLIVLDDNGKILWRCEGEMTREKLNLLQRILQSYKIKN